ncbi:hypothetical protein PC129_g23792 [Phytophthora cactorum]|uniref:NADH-ubiquinone reductase complex 1 MLRQ subunit n=1 Tax=Phytophthora cactorum TaxID=29920 RepID=A0A8T1EY72_9STRA|nr:hypothetical protein Pcac1_g26050 [Phytophthora cactorum]KAG2791235.1 hypothetical protein PC111_g24024 [Phytophthora cactorum]KAG2791684.1 hypothetical protein PC112_g24154 [Phytophthora cactorum]KAG2808910.1 hypothetical protein PC113_g23922 [Phytophthora cactorum]KAG2875750.1 hypothetical protein PC115_g23819 [Phytophthora cactorum]
MQKLVHAHTVVDQPRVPVPIPAGPRARKALSWCLSRCAEIYPLVFSVSVGLAIGAFSLGPHGLFDPDVNVSCDRRETPAWERYKPEEGQAFSRNRHHLANLKPNPVDTFPRLVSFKRRPMNHSLSSCKESTVALDSFLKT